MTIVKNGITYGSCLSHGNKLKPTDSFIAYWLFIGAFYPDAQIYE
jgi:hypothetical protein